jgi:hypothetical protein
MTQIGYATIRRGRNVHTVEIGAGGQVERALCGIPARGRWRKPDLTRPNRPACHECQQAEQLRQEQN